MVIKVDYLSFAFFWILLSAYAYRYVVRISIKLLTISCSAALLVLKEVFYGDEDNYLEFYNLEYKKLNYYTEIISNGLTISFSIMGIYGFPLMLTLNFLKRYFLVIYGMFFLSIILQRCLEEFIITPIRRKQRINQLFNLE